MLVLSRKQREEIQIGDDITIMLVQTSDKTARIGIKAPKDVKILRSELQPGYKPPEPKYRDDVAANLVSEMSLAIGPGK